MLHPCRGCSRPDDPVKWQSNEFTMYHDRRTGNISLSHRTLWGPQQEVVSVPCQLVSGKKNHLGLSFSRKTIILFIIKSIKRELKTRPIYECRSDERQEPVCLFLIEKTRVKDKTYIWGSVWWKTQKLKLRNLHDSHTLGCVIPVVTHT